MHLVEKLNGILEYVADANETPENQEFLRKLGDYRIQRQGASIYFFAKSDNRQVLFCNIFDNTFFINDTRGFALAAEFGTKRFLIGQARSALTEEQAQNVNATQFSRDLSFPLNASAEEKSTSFKVVTLAELLAIHEKNPDKFYENQGELFHRCADFTPGKQDEYLTGGNKIDKFCRFNLENHQPLNSTVTEQVFLLDKQNKVVGTISATILVQEDGTIAVYFYDEIVDYFTRLQTEEKAALEKLYKNEEKLSEENQKAAIAKIIEPRRLELMEPLFAAARNQVMQTINKLSAASGENLIRNGKVHAFIRAAAGRVDSYKALGCGKEPSPTYVIHGPPTDHAKMLDRHIKNWADQQLVKVAKNSPNEVKTSQKSSYLSYGKTAFSFGVAFAAVGILAYKFWPRTSNTSSLPAPESMAGRGLGNK